MRHHHLLLAILCAGALSACSDDSGPLAPEAATPDAAAPAAGDRAPFLTTDLEDARDRVTLAFDAPAAGRLRGALEAVIAGVRTGDAASRTGAVEAALRMVDEAEREAGDGVAADADAIRMALDAHGPTN
jgi:hypothetical protein